MTIEKQEPESKPAGSLNPDRPFADELDKVWEQLVSGKEEEEQEDAVREEEGEEEGEKEEVETKPEDSEDEPDEESLEPLEQWPESVKDRFKDLSREDQLWMIDTYKGFQSDYTKKTQEISSLKKAVEPVLDQIEELGISEGEAISNLVNTHIAFQNMPYTTAKFVFESYGIDVDELRNNWDNPQEADQAINPQKREEIRKKEKAQLEAQKQKAAEGEKKWKAFAKEHEYAETLRPVMIGLAHAEFQENGEVPPLDALYERAMWVNDKTRQIAMKNAENGDLADRVEKKKNSVEKAKNASKSVKRGSITSDPEPDEPKTMREEMSILYDQLSSN